jgi:hypothetical protein
VNHSRLSFYTPDQQANPVRGVGRNQPSTTDSISRPNLCRLERVEQLSRCHPQTRSGVLMIQHLCLKFSLTRIICGVKGTGFVGVGLSPRGWDTLNDIARQSSLHLLDDSRLRGLHSIVDCWSIQAGPFLKEISVIVRAVCLRPLLFSSRIIKTRSHSAEATLLRSQHLGLGRGGSMRP